MKDILKAVRREWLADEQDDFIRERFWDRATVALVIFWVVVIVLFTLFTK
jgi:hypothetical protein